MSMLLKFVYRLILYLLTSICHMFSFAKCKIEKLQFLILRLSYVLFTIIKPADSIVYNLNLMLFQFQIFSGF